MAAIARPILRIPARQLIHRTPSTRHLSWESVVTVVPNYFTHWSLTQACQWTLETVHVYTGIPWWATIVGTTVAFKLLTSPLLYAGEKALARRTLMKAMTLRQMPAMKAEIDRLAETVKITEEKKQLWLKLSMRKYERVLSASMGTHPFALLCWPILQMPVWISMSFAIRNLSGRNPYYFEYDDAIVDELSTQGFLWISNLTLPDPFLILPAVNCIFYLVAPTVSLLGSPVGLKKTISYRIGRVVNVVATGFVTLIAIQLPAIITLYWATSMFTTLVLRVVLKMPRIRRKLSIDPAPFESQSPVKELMLRTVGQWKKDDARKSITLKK